MGAFVSLIELRLFFAESHDLKGKRKELHSLKAGIRQRFGASVAEVDHQDLWQRATLAAALTGGSLPALEVAAASIERFLEARFPDGVRVERTLVSLEDLRGVG